ncbi:MAG: hypothetical protein RLN85_03310, partial [Pseudomonadales bacterium]
DLMRPLKTLMLLSPNTRMMSALSSMAQVSEEPALVVDEGKLLGMIQRGDVMQWMVLHGGFQAK